MPNENKNIEDKKSDQGVALKVVLIIVYLLVLLYLYYLFVVEFGSNPYVVLIILLFVIFLYGI